MSSMWIWHDMRAATTARSHLTMGGWNVAEMRQLRDWTRIRLWNPSPFEKKKHYSVQKKEWDPVAAIVR